MITKRKDIEILSPAGGYESVVSAVLNGANAVYLGGSGFNARQNAQNFSSEELKKAVDYCHLHGVKVYQTLNVVVFDDEILDLTETIKSSCEIGIDAFIVQDLAVLRLVREICPKMKLNASTQMTVHTKEGAKLLKKMGFSRVVLSRELTLNEIKDIVDNVDIEVEVFAHGALCMSVSGQCYMSSVIGGRSGNKGSCAGTCRLPFTSNNDKSAYDLSLKDLCSVDDFAKLCEIGVTSLKIEGRMKRPEYVAITAKSYSGLKDDIIPDVSELRAVFSRSGFTSGYLDNKIDGDMFGFRSKEDVVSSTKDLLNQWRDSYNKEKATTPLKMTFTAKKGENTSLFVSDDKGHSCTVIGEEAPVAINKPTTIEMATESLTKLGGTVFFADSVEVFVDDGLIIPKSKLNQMRRDAIDDITNQIIKVTDKPVLDVQVKKAFPKTVKNMKLRARVRELDQLTPKLLDKMEVLHIPFEELLKTVAGNSHVNLSAYKDKIVIEIDRVMFSNEDKIIDSLKTLKEAGFAKLAVSNLAHIGIADKLGLEKYGTAFLNITNSYSLDSYAKMGVCDSWLSFENGVADINKINALDNSQVKTGFVAYGYLPLMAVRNCPVRPNHDCATCHSSHSLTDRLGNKFRVLCQNKRYSEVLNCKVLRLSDRLDEFRNCDYGVLYFTVENADQVDSVVGDYLRNAKAQGDFTRGLYYRGIR